MHSGSHRAISVRSPRWTETGIGKRKGRDRSMSGCVALSTPFLCHRPAVGHHLVGSCFRSRSCSTRFTRSTYPSSHPHVVGLRSRLIRAQQRVCTSVLRVENGLNPRSKRSVLKFDERRSTALTTLTSSGPSGPALHFAGSTMT